MHDDHSLCVGLFVWLASAFAVTARARRGTRLTSGPVGAAGALGSGGRIGLSLRRALVMLQVALSLAASLAGALPARRAARLDPAATLRAE